MYKLSLKRRKVFQRRHPYEVENAIADIYSELSIVDGIAQKTCNTSVGCQAEAKDLA